MSESSPRKVSFAAPLESGGAAHPSSSASEHVEAKDEEGGFMPMLAAVGGLIPGLLTPVITSALSIAGTGSKELVNNPLLMSMIQKALGGEDKANINLNELLAEADTSGRLKELMRKIQVVDSEERVSPFNDKTLLYVSIPAITAIVLGLIFAMKK